MFLERECAGDEAVRRRVEHLLREHSAGEGFLSQSDAAAVHEVPGMRIGPYRLLEKLGEGGFGAVFLAEQTEPFVRRVALKVIKLGMDTRQVIARFEAERQALAMMDHPNIAKVLDAGATETGRPYFVMELVKGEPITRFCDEHHLDTAARLDLFQKVCIAVQHAHQKGIIHRDLKPGNVLVSEQDGAPVPKVIDFGIAKATVARLTEKTLFTQQRAWIGTPEYMSPEQAGLAGSDVDTRSDVYSLGVLLYELLTGTTPFSARELRAGAFEEVQRMIREVEPPRPSTRISTMSEAIVTIAERRRTEPSRLAKLVRGDLDWIVMKCIEKDRSRRYETASALAQDVLRHVRGEPVLAAPPSAAYRVRKFVRLHRVGVAAGAAVALVLLLGMAGTSTGLAWALREQERAGESEKDAKEAAEQARSVTEFLTGLLGLANADVSQRPDLTVREVLDRAAERVGEVFRGQPEAEATVRTVIGQAYDTLGEPTLAVIHLGRALELRDGPEGGTPTQLYDILFTYMYAVQDATRGTGSIPRGGNYRVAVACRRAIAETHPELSEPCAAVLRAAQPPTDVPQVLSSLEGILATARATFPADDPAWIYVADYFCGSAMVVAMRDPDLAVGPTEVALKIYRRVLPETHTRIVRTMDGLVDQLGAAGRHAEAERVARGALNLAARRLPQDHWYLAWCRQRIGAGLVGQGRLEEAEPLLLGAFPPLDAAHSTSPRTLRTLGALLALHERAGRRQEVERWRAMLVDRVARAEPADDRLTPEDVLGPDLRALAASTKTAADALRRRAADAAACYDAYVALRRSSFPDTDPRAACLARLLLLPADDFAGSGVDPDGAMRVILDIVAVGRACPSIHAGRRALGLWWCARICELRARFREGESFAREGLRETEGPLGSDHWMVANLRRVLGSNLAGQGRDEEAERMLEAGYEGLMSAVGPENVNTRIAFLSLARFHAARGGLRRTSELGSSHMDRLFATDADAVELDAAAWCIVTVPGLGPGAYAAALEASSRLIATGSYEPGQLNTLGAAQYRLGRFDEALATLRRSAELAEQGPGGPWVYDHAFLAMTHARLGNAGEAAVALLRARELARIPEQGAMAEADGFLREAEAVVEGN